MEDTEPHVQRSSMGHAGKLAWGPQGSASVGLSVSALATYQLAIFMEIESKDPSLKAADGRGRFKFLSTKEFTRSDWRKATITAFLASFVTYQSSNIAFIQVIGGVLFLFGIVSAVYWIRGKKIS